MPENTRYSDVREEVLRERTARMLLAPELTVSGKELVPTGNVHFAEGGCVHLHVSVERTSLTLPLASLNFQVSQGIENCPRFLVVQVGDAHP